MNPKKANGFYQLLNHSKFKKKHTIFFKSCNLGWARDLVTVTAYLR